MDYLEVMPLPVLVFAICGTLTSLFVGTWTGYSFLVGILKGIYQRYKSNDLE